jgi:hypothetical protein
MNLEFEFFIKLVYFALGFLAGFVFTALLVDYTDRANIKK